MSSKSVKFLPASNKPINPIQKYPHITCLYSRNIYYIYRFINKSFNIFWNMFNSKTIKKRIIIIQCMQNNPMSFNTRMLIKIYYIWPILYLIWYIIYRTNTSKSRFILIIVLYFKFS